MHWTKKVLTTVLALAFVMPAIVWAADLELRDATISTDVQDRIPTGTGVMFDSDVGKLYAFTRIVGADGETRIYHKWYHGDRLMADVPLNVRSGDWRTWSSKTIVPHWTGDWRVVIVAEDGSVLGSVKFTLS